MIPSTLLTLTMVPPPWLRISGTTARQTRIRPKTLTSKTSRIASMLVRLALGPSTTRGSQPDILGSPTKAVSSIVDDHVYFPVPVFDSRYDGLNVFGFHVHLDPRAAEVFNISSLGSWLGTASACHDNVSCLRSCLGKFESQAARGPRDEPDLGRRHSNLLV